MITIPSSEGTKPLIKEGIFKNLGEKYAAIAYEQLPKENYHLIPEGYFPFK